MQRATGGSSDSESDQSEDITEEFEHWPLHWYHVEALEIAEQFSSGEINDAELLSQQFGLEDKLEALQRADYSIYDYAQEHYTTKSGSWECECDCEGMETARRIWRVQDI